jgi:DNA repair exonuclease SbcCD ATPase subunit
MSEPNNNDLSEIVDNMMDGVEELQDHSLNIATDEQSLANNETAPEKDFTEVIDTDSAEDEKSVNKTDGTPPDGDSEPEKNKIDFDAEIASLRAENENLKKRFHDTQQAMHKANTEKSELQKQLDALTKKAEEDSDDDDWFDNSDKNTAEDDHKLEDIRKNLKALESRQEEYQQEIYRQKWVDEAEKFAEKHEDFEELVYQKLQPLLDEETGDAMLRALYLQQSDKSPKGAYEFAKKLFEYKSKIDSNAPIETNKTEAVKTEKPALGKAGLDRLNSAEFPEEKKVYVNVVDEVFG